LKKHTGERREAAVPSYAVAYTPPPFSPLAKFGAGILGYDCFEGADVKQRAVPGIDPALLSLLTVAPRRAGFQATVVPPFSLHERRENELRQAVATLAQDHHPMLLGPLSFAYVGAFIVLRTEKTSARLRQFAGACRAAFEPFSTPAAADSSDSLWGAGGIDLGMACAPPLPPRTHSQARSGPGD